MYIKYVQLLLLSTLYLSNVKRPKKRISLKKLNPNTTTTIVSQQQLMLDRNSGDNHTDNGNNEEADTPTNTAPTRTYRNLTTTTTSDELETAIKIEINNATIATTTTTTTTSTSTSSTTSTVKPLESAMASSTSPTKKSGHGQEVKRITFDESCKKESFDDVNPNYPQISVVVRPPTPLRGDSVKPTASSAASSASLLATSSSLLGVRTLNSSEIRRHSSHAPSLAVRDYDKDKDRRHSGFNPNFLTLDPEHARFLSSSPAASRRISCGSLFKVSPDPKQLTPPHIPYLYIYT